MSLNLRSSCATYHICCLMVIFITQILVEGQHQKFWIHKSWYSDSECRQWYKYEGYNITSSGCVPLEERYLLFNSTTWESWICNTSTCDPASCSTAPINGSYDFASYSECKQDPSISVMSLWAKSEILPYSAMHLTTPQAQEQYFPSDNTDCTGNILRVVGWTTGVCVKNPLQLGLFPYGKIVCSSSKVSIEGSYSSTCSFNQGQASMPSECYQQRLVPCSPNTFVPINWATLAPDQVRSLDSRVFEVLPPSAVSTIPVQVIPYISPEQIKRVSADALASFTPYQAALFDYKDGENSTCAVLKVPWMMSGMSGVVPPCMALLGPDILALFDSNSIQRISTQAFSAISDFSHLKRAVFGSATLDQLSAIPWVAPILSDHLVDAITVHNVRLIHRWNTSQLDCWSGDQSTTYNIVQVKSDLQPIFAQFNVNRSSDPSYWTWLHVAIISSDPQIPPSFWEPVLPRVPPQALRGLQPVVRGDFSFLKTITATVAQYFLPDYTTRSGFDWVSVNPDAMQGFSSAVYAKLGADHKLLPIQIASMDPAKIPFSSGFSVEMWCDVLNRSSFWPRVRPELVSAFQDTIDRYHMRVTIPPDASSGQLIIPPPYTDNRYTWNVSIPTTSPTGNKETQAPSSIANNGGESSTIVWRTLFIVFIVLSVPCIVVLGIVCIKNRRLKRNLRILMEGERRPLLRQQSSPTSLSKLTLWDRAALLERIGGGGSGAQIFRCSVQGLTCAAKVLDCSHAFEKQIVEFKQEVDVLIEASKRSDWVVKYLHHSYNPVSRKFFIFMEFFPGTLQTQITQMRHMQSSSKDTLVEQIRFSAATIGRIGHGILSGLKALHNYSRHDEATTGTNPARKGASKKNKPIIHRDLKPANVFAAFDEVGDVVLIKLGDFCISKLLSATNQAKTAMCGTPGYMAPEVVRAGEDNVDASYSTAADIYSFGMVLYELMTLQPPFFDVESEAQRNKLILAGELPVLPSHIEGDEEYAELVQIWKECVKLDPKGRPTAAQLLERRAFKSWLIS